MFKWKKKIFNENQNHIKNEPNKHVIFPDEKGIQQGLEQLLIYENDPEYNLKLKEIIEKKNLILIQELGLN